MAFIKSPPIDWGNDPPQAMTELFPVYSQDVETHVFVPNVIAAVPTSSPTPDESDTVAYPIAG